MIPLLSSGSILEQIFYTMRHNAISSSQAFVKIAFAVACVFVLIRLVKLAYNIISDEQHGGFGGVKLWDILKPIVFLILIQGAPLVVSAIDYTTGIVVNSVSNSHAIADADAKFDEQMKDVQKKYEEQVAAECAVDDDEEGGFFSPFINWIKQKLIDLWESVNNFFVGSSFAIGGRFIPWLCVKLFNILGFCFLIVSNVFLCVLAMLFPFTICLELLDIWKGNFGRFAAMYVQVSFWKVILVVVQWIIADVRVGATTVGLQMISGMVDSDSMLGAAEAAIWVQALICIAGVMCIKKIPQWATAVIGGGIQEATGGGGEVAGSINGVPGQVAKVGGAALMA